MNPLSEVLFWIPWFQVLFWISKHHGYSVAHIAWEFSDQDKVDLILLTILPIVLFNLFIVGTHEERLAKGGSKQQDGWER